MDKMEILEYIERNVGETYFLDCLAEQGFISSEEAKNLQGNLITLPQSKKTLIAGYVQYSPLINSSSRITSNHIDILRDAKDNATIQGLKDWLSLNVTLRKECATNFVLNKRGRIRQELKRAILVQIANALSVAPYEDKETGEALDNIPYLRNVIKGYGYREDAKELNDDDRKALSLCADYYLDWLEVLSLNGEGARILEEINEITNEEGELTETFYYETIAHEAIDNFREIYEYQNMLYGLALSSSLNGVGSAPYKDFSVLMNARKGGLSSGIAEALLKTKFAEYANTLYSYRELKNKLTPTSLRKWEEYLAEFKEDYTDEAK